MKDALPADKKVKVIDLSAKDLPAVPLELLEYTQLEMLTLRKNRLNAISPEIGTLVI